MITYLSIIFNSKDDNNNVKECATFCTACDLADYKPVDWKSKIVPVLKSIKFHEGEKFPVFEQFHLATTINRLGFCNFELLKNVLRSEINKCYYKDDPRLIELQTVFEAEQAKRKGTCNEKTDGELINEASLETTFEDDELTMELESWMITDLKRIVGADCVATNIQIDDDVTIPMVIKINRKTGNFVKMQPKTSIEELKCSDSELL